VLLPLPPGNIHLLLRMDLSFPSPSWPKLFPFDSMKITSRIDNSIESIFSTGSFWIIALAGPGSPAGHPLMPPGSPADASGNDMDATLVSLGQHQSESAVVQGRAPGRRQRHQGHH